jgi:hypothetical protein
MAATHAFQGAGAISGSGTIDAIGNSSAQMLNNGHGGQLAMIGGDLSAVSSICPVWSSATRCCQHWACRSGKAECFITAQPSTGAIFGFRRWSSTPVKPS